MYEVSRHTPEEHREEYVEAAEVYQQLALLTDNQAERCLNGVIGGLVETKPQYARLLVRPDDMSTVVQRVAEDTDHPLDVSVGEVDPEQRPEAIRLILAQMVEDQELRERLVAQLRTGRDTLIEPITTAVVLAGIILVLSTHVKIDYERQNGQSTLDVQVEKKPTANEILKKFFGFFGA